MPACSSKFPSTRAGRKAEVWAEKTAAGVRLMAALEGEPPSRDVLDDLDDLVVLADDASRYLDANAAFCRATGYSLSEIKTLGVKDLSAGQPIIDPAEMWGRFLRQGAMAGRYPILLKNGSVWTMAFQAFTNVLPGAHLSILRPL